MVFYCNRAGQQVLSQRIEVPASVKALSFPYRRLETALVSIAIL